MQYALTFQYLRYPKRSQIRKETQKSVVHIKKQGNFCIPNTRCINLTFNTISSIIYYFNFICTNDEFSNI